MAFVKTANAKFVRNITALDAWVGILSKADPIGNHRTRVASTIPVNEFTPDKYVLSHCTIVASVDTEPGEDADKLGRVFHEGFQIERKYSDYFVKVDHDSRINNNCFVPGTLIALADGTVKPIEQIEVGDEVVTHKGRVRRVTETFRHPSKGTLYELKSEDGTVLRATAEHPFYVHRDGPSTGWFGFVPLAKLTVADRLVSLAAREPCTYAPHDIKSVEPVEYEGDVFNFEVEDDHSYIANGLAVHNSDAFERELLLQSYQTFVGGQNFVEHIQIPELSKGRIIDAAARDVGDAIYVDILVATDRKHTDLVADIEAGRMVTLSMGAVVAFTVCTKCGNVAVDETDLCSDVKYSKGNYFYDRRGNRRRVAEACGHRSVPGSVKFIEASWVRDPAFAGAVLRNILKVDPIKEPVLAKQIQAAFEMGARRLSPDEMVKVASVIQAGIFDFGPPEGQGQKSEGQKPDQKPEEPPKDKKNDVIEELSDELLEKAKERARSKVVPPAPHAEVNENDNMLDSQASTTPDPAIQQSQPTQEPAKPANAARTGTTSTATTQASHEPSYRQFVATYGAIGLDKERLSSVYSILQHLRRGGWKTVAASGRYTGEQVLTAVEFLDRFGKVSPTYRLGRDGYAAIQAVGGTDRFKSPKDYLVACAQQMGRQVSADEASALIVKGKLYALVSRRDPALKESKS